MCDTNEIESENDYEHNRVFNHLSSNGVQVEFQI